MHPKLFHINFLWFCYERATEYEQLTLIFIVMTFQRVKNRGLGSVALYASCDHTWLCALAKCHKTSLLRCYQSNCKATKKVKESRIFVDPGIEVDTVPKILEILPSILSQKMLLFSSSFLVSHPNNFK